MPAPLSVADAVSAHLRPFLARMRDEATAHGAEAMRFHTAAERTLTGGKRLRARFCHAGWESVALAKDGSAIAPDSLWGVCAALEIFQASALVHDDIIDNSDLRRGNPSAHRAMQSDHVAAGWHGDAEGFGRASAILLGDLLLAWSDDLLEESIAGLPHADAVRREYARMRRDVISGQFLDVAEESAWSVNPIEEHAARALHVVALKSARYSVVEPLLIGALLAGADAAQLAALEAFGLPVGIAFQLRDDVLGVFGDEAITGKPAGDDLREGKRTVLIALTRQHIPPTARAVLDGLLGDSELERDQISMLQATISDSGALDDVEAIIADYAEEAVRALNGARLDNAAVSGLRELARQATSRVA